ncbi:hypothetical protein [Xanthomonas nasturtii]|uniref:hypothetical protein n=1 Tax=Xanthomonas nasturtii TaxID=1843581 RepID=UPI002012C854|nr:hypothetical protein [Xanthomonas nasturtii]MCL1526916.1 hypothetical protein [Xanthomonas nasturtii]MCL1534569.1 hypothetical protein [Xanthomonas nasturtii]MCL1544126.1 hypothetical protein [Xanthomonas nasturtii]
MITTADFIGPSSQDEFVRALETEDIIGCVLRLHLHVEELLAVLLNSSITTEIAKIITVPQNFSHKVQLATAFGMPVEMGLAALELNGLRNKLGHRLGHQLKREDVSRFAEQVDAVREVLFASVPSVMVSAIELYSTGSGKRQFGEGDPIWDFKITAGLLYGWMLGYLAERGCLIQTA